MQPNTSTATAGAAPPVFDVAPERLAAMSLLDFADLLKQWFTYIVSEDEEQAFTVALLYSTDQLNRPGLFQDYVAEWKRYAGDQDTIPLEARILAYPLSISQLGLVVQALQLNFYAIVAGLNNMNRQDYITMGVSNLREIYPPETTFDVATLVTLRDQALERLNYIVHGYLNDLLEQQQQLERRANAAPAPRWILPPPLSVATSGPMPTHNQLKAWLAQRFKGITIELYTSVRPQQGAAIVAQLIYGAGVDTDAGEAYQHYLLEQFQRLAPQDLTDTVNEIVRNTMISQRMREDVEVFRVFGACHPIPGPLRLELASDDPCLRNGGCRVYDCTHVHNYDPLTEQELYPDAVATGMVSKINWRGDKTCYSCGILVLKTCYCVRKPCLRGGWYGYYCSWSCVRTDTEPADEVTLALINDYEQRYLNNGTYDRA
jgi:hypothetical protein